MKRMHPGADEAQIASGEEVGGRITLREYLFGGGARYASRYRIVEVLSVCVYFVLVALVALDLARVAWNMPNTAWLLVAASLLGYLTADFLSGFVHWLADTYAESDTPFVGPKFVRPFREHHVDPLAITRHDFVEANGDNCFMALLPLVPAAFLAPITSTPAWAFFGAWALSLALGVLLTSIAHGWAHMPAQTPFVAWLQRVGLVLSPDHHAQHHEAPFDRNYCITTGWLNGVLDAVGFFRKAERVLRLFGIRPGSHIARERAAAAPAATDGNRS